MAKGASRCPYPGLRSFEYEERKLFFGRELHVRELRAKLARNHFVAVIGGSGSGKSSLVKAGLLPILAEEGAARESARWQWLLFRPGLDPIDSLVRELIKVGRTIAPDLVSERSECALVDYWSADLSHSSHGLHKIITGFATAGNISQRMAVLVVVDQFEELFRYEDIGTQHPGERKESARALVRALLTSTELVASPIEVHVLITMRSDFIGDCIQFSGLPEAISTSQFLVPNMTRDQRREAITKPVADRVEPALVQELLNATDAEQDDLPLMQHALMRTWHKSATSRTSRLHLLSLNTYKEIGGFDGALSGHADQLYSELLAADPKNSAEMAHTIEYVFRALSDIDPEGREIRRPCRFVDLVKLTGNEALVRAMIERLGARDCSFLVTYVDVLNGQEIVDVSHEALIRRWKRISDKTPDNAGRHGHGWIYQEQGDGELWRALLVQAQALQDDPHALLSEETTKRREKWFDSIPRPSRQAWSDRYGGGYDAVEQLLDRSLELARQGQRISARLGEKNVENIEAIEKRSRVSEYRAKRNFSRMIALWAREAIRNGEIRTGLMMAAEILASTTAAPVARTTSLSRDLERGSSLGADPSGRPTTVSNAAVRDEPRPGLSDLVYVPEGEHAAYLALQRQPKNLSPVGTPVELTDLRAIPAFLEPDADSSSRHWHDRVVLDFGRDDTLLFAEQSTVPDVYAVSFRATTWQALTATLVGQMNIAGRFIGGNQGGASSGVFALIGRDVIWSNQSRSAHFPLPNWLEGHLFPRVSPSGNVVAIIDSRGRHFLLRLNSDKPEERPSFDVLFEGKAPYPEEFRWHVDFSIDGKRLFVLSDNLKGFGLEWGTTPKPHRVIEISRDADPGGCVIALDPAQWRWARSVMNPGDWRISIGGGTTPQGLRIAAKADAGSAQQSRLTAELTLADKVASEADPEEKNEFGSQVAVIVVPTADMDVLTEQSPTLASIVDTMSISQSAPPAGEDSVHARFSADGTRLVLAFRRGPLLLYSLADTSAPIGIFGSAADRFVAAVCSPRGDLLAGAREDGGAVIWPIFPDIRSLLGQARRELSGASGNLVALTSGQRLFLGFEPVALPQYDRPLSAGELSPALPITLEEQPQIHPNLADNRNRSSLRAFVIMPFGKKTAADGTVIDFDAVYKEFLAPAIVATGLAPHRADADRRGGSIHLDMFQDLLLAEFVVADLTLDNPNVWYEIGVRHALRAGGAVLTFALRDRLPFDIAGQRMQRYTLKGGRLDPDLVEAERNALKEAIEATLGSWRGRRASPVYQQLPNLREPDWKTIKVGDVNEFWQALEAWQSRVEVARRKQRPGDILVLAEETPNSVLEFEALRTAARALARLGRPRYALDILERARRLEPDDVEARQLEGIALGRAERYAEARESLRRLAEERKDGETLGLLARTWKDEWTQIWSAHPQRKLDPIAAARDTAATLQSAASAYIEAFRAAPGDYYPGINALTLGRLWEHITGRHSRLPLDLVAAGVGWTVAAAAERNKDYWSLASRAELALIENRKDEAIDDYSEASALAVGNRDWFALDSSSQQLDFLGELKFQSEIVAEAAAVIDRAEQQLHALLGGRPEERSEPDHVVVFSGHMIDNPADRGGGKPKPPRFPPSKIEAAAARIRAALDEVGAGSGDLGLCGGASGGDLLFAEACLDRGMRIELHLARAENEFLAESVTFADPDHRWERSFTQVTENPGSTVLVMPEELGPAPAGVSVHDRCNRWMLYSALSQGLRRASFITLWNGEPGDGPGGTQNMIELVRKLTGRQPIIIDPATL